MTAATPHIYGQVGALVLPVERDALLTDLDPVRDKLLDLFKTAMNAELGDPWAKAVAGLLDKHSLYNSTPVSDTMGLEASLSHIQQRSAKFPLLCLHRSGRGEDEPHTLYESRLKQPWELHYILGPLEVADARRFGDACIFFAKLVERVIENRGHPAFEDGAPQFFGDGEVADIGAIRKTGHEGPGQAHFAGGPDSTTYYAITIGLETLEYCAPNADAEAVPLQGADYDFGIGGSEAGVIRGLLYASTDPPFQPQ